MKKFSSINDFLINQEIGESSFSVGGVCGRLTVYSYEKPLVITFSNAGETVSKKQWLLNEDNIWGYNYIKGMKLNVLSFSCLDKANWYRDATFHDFLVDLSDCLKYFPARLGYGGSMGGYAVSAFSNCLGIERLLLLNPVSTLNKELVPFEKRFLDAQDLEWDSRFKDGAETNSTGFVIYDPIFDLDAKHAKRYTALDHYCLPGVGHQMPIHLKKLNMLKLCFEAFYKNESFETFFYNKARDRRGYDRYFKWMLSGANKHLTTKRRLVIQKHYRMHLAKKDSSLIISRNDVALLRDQAIFLYDSGLYRSSLDLLNVLIRINPNGKEINKYRSLALARMEEKNEL